MNLAEVFTAIEGPDAPVEFVAYDGSKAGTVGSDIRVELRSPKAVELILSHPGQVGLARAYVAGELEIRGDIVQMLELLWSRTKNHRMSWNSRVQLVKQFGPDTLRAITGHRGEAPPEEKAPRAAPLKDAMLKRSPITTTCPTRSIDGSWAPRWPTRAPCSPPRPRLWNKRKRKSSISSAASSA